jgi:RNA polymerase sigma-70 factor (ECF subfamily)
MESSQGQSAKFCDAELVSALKAGDDAAFEELVRLYSGSLFATIQRYLHHEHDAWDALQETFLSAFRAIRRFDGRSTLATWLHRIAVNVAVMKWRSQRRAPVRSIEDLLPNYYDDGHRRDPGPAWGSLPLDRIEVAEMRELVRQCITELPDIYREILILRDIEQWDTATVATHLDIEEGAVKTRLHRARQALRTLLDPYFREGSP